MLVESLIVGDLLSYFDTAWMIFLEGVFGFGGIFDTLRGFSTGFSASFTGTEVIDYFLFSSILTGGCSDAGEACLSIEGIGFLISSFDFYFLTG